MEGHAQPETKNDRNSLPRWQPDPSDGWLLFLAIALGVLVVVLAYPH
jgi:hypothetical protein